LPDTESVITSASDSKLVLWNVFNSDVLPKKHFEHRDLIYCLELL